MRMRLDSSYMTTLPKPKRITNRAYLKWIKEQPCLTCKCSNNPYSLIDAHHVLPKMGGKVGSKTDDTRAVPLCRDAHRDYHDNGREEFEKNYEIDLEAEIARLNAEYRKL